MKSITKNAYGKVNLFLAVGGKRADGRHDVETVLCRVGVYDTVTVTEIEGNKVELVCDDKSLPTNEENIAFLAALRYFEHSGLDKGVRISIEKRIPVKAGMGGGSSDAAAVLSALNDMYGALAFDGLCVIASGIGADVPFFLYEKNVMLGKGTGTELYECGELGFEAYGVFVMHGEKLSTGKAYEALDNAKQGNTVLRKADGLIGALYDVFKTAGEIQNDFELCCSTFNEVADKLYELGALKAFLCGSGPTVCGLFDTREAAEAAASVLGYRCFVTTVGV